MKNLYTEFYDGGGFKFYCKLCTKIISSSRGIIYHLGSKHRCVDDLIKDQQSRKTFLSTLESPPPEVFTKAPAYDTAASNVGSSFFSQEFELELAKVEDLDS